MTFRTEQFITRQMVRSDPKALFVFGDNMKGTGYGGQAASMRGERNTVGIPTKWAPYMTPNSFFSDDDFDVVAPVIQKRFQLLIDYMAAGGDVVWPADGVGTGRAELIQRAPRIWTLIETLHAFLQNAPCRAIPHPIELPSL